MGKLRLDRLLISADSEDVGVVDDLELSEDDRRTRPDGRRRRPLWQPLAENLAKAREPGLPRARRGRSNFGVPLRGDVAAGPIGEAERGLKDSREIDRHFLG